jgi:hypothetical protein
MSGGHAINLGNAWESEPGDDGHAAEWVRRFGRPTGLEPGDSLWLVIEEPAACTLVFNGARLPESGPGAEYRIEITPLVRDRNLLVLVPHDGAAVGAAAVGRVPLPTPLGRVRLEIVPAGVGRPAR